MSTLGIFVKHPVPGKVKTRLGAEIGLAPAAQLYEAFQRDILDSTKTIDCQRVIAYSPDTDEATSWLKELASENDTLWVQPDVSLGDRLSQFFNEYLAVDDRVVVIGSDSPTIPCSLIQSAFELLKQSDVVLGPAIDGGYYLIGQRTSCPEIFQDIDWSSASVLMQTVNRVREQRRSLSLLTPWYDIDSLDDLRFLDSHLVAMEHASHSDPIPWRTKTLVTTIVSRLESSSDS